MEAKILNALCWLAVAAAVLACLVVAGVVPVAATAEAEYTTPEPMVCSDRCGHLRTPADVEYLKKVLAEKYPETRGTDRTRPR